MGEQLARVIGAPAPVESEPLVLAFPRRSRGGQLADEAILGGHLEADIGIGGKEGWHDAR